jgi:uncharacterized membrane protein
MPTTEERLGVVETKVEHLNEKVDDIKQNIKDANTNIKENHVILMKKLEDMDRKYEINRDAYYEKLEENKQDEEKAHKAMNQKIDNLEQFKMKWIYIVTGAAIIIGWVSAHGDSIFKLLKTF